MKKSIFAMIMALSLCFGLNAVENSTAPQTGVTVTASVEKAQVGHAKWFDGNWLAVEKYGISPKFGGTQEGVTAYFEVKAQQKAYTEAKANKDLHGMVANAFWASSQVWAYNNAAHELLISDKPSKEDAAKAKELLLKATEILQTSANLNPDDSANEAQKSAWEGEEKNLINAGVKVDSNLTYAKRLLGELPWPKVKK